MIKVIILCLLLTSLKLCYTQPANDKVTVIESESHNVSNYITQDAQNVLKSALQDKLDPCDSLGQHFEDKYGTGLNWHCIVCTGYRIRPANAIVLKVGDGNSNYLLFSTKK